MGKRRDRRQVERMERAMEKEDTAALRRLEGRKKRHILRKTVLTLGVLLCAGLCFAF